MLMLRCSGSRRISVVIQDKKGKYMVVQKNDEDDVWNEFPGFSYANAEVDDEEKELESIVNGINDILEIEITNLKWIETFFDDSIPWRHYIYRAELKSGNPVKKYYNKIYWKQLKEIDPETLNLYGLQVWQKISECAYCRRLCDKKPERERFFAEYMSHDAGMLVSNVLSAAGDNEEVYKIAIRYYFSHLRAWLVETDSPERKKNRTIQNYLKLYERIDLLEEVDALLDLNITDKWSLKTLIKDFVDKNVAHYDKATKKTEQVVEFCEETFSKNGNFPLQEFVPFVERYMMSIVLEMWFYAGELGADIGNPSPDFAIFMNVDRISLLEHIKERFGITE